MIFYRGLDMDSIIRKRALCFKCIMIEFAISMCIVSFLLTDSILASELPTIELNTTSAEDIEKTQAAKQSEIKEANNTILYVVIVIISVVSVISMVINVILICNSKKNKEYNKKIDELKSKYIDDTEKEVVSSIKEEQNIEEQTNISKMSSTSMLWKIAIQLFDKANNILYETSFDSLKENTEIRIGRGDKAKVDIKIPLPNVSDEHCLLLKRADAYYLIDLDSTNGTKYNGEKVTDRVLIEHNGELNLGTSKFELIILDKQNKE